MRYVHVLMSRETYANDVERVQSDYVRHKFDIVWCVLPWGAQTRGRMRGDQRDYGEVDDSPLRGKLERQNAIQNMYTSTNTIMGGTY